MLGIYPPIGRDELFSGFIGRLADRLGTNAKALTAWFGPGVLSLGWEFPRLGPIVSALPADFGLDIPRTVTNHTMFPYYSGFVCDGPTRIFRRLMIEGVPTPGLADLHLSGVPNLKRLRFCPECVAADMADMAAGRWRRCHQFVGLSLCPDHQMPLREGEGVPKPGQLLAPPPGDAAGPEAATAFSVEQNRQLVSGAVWLMENQRSPFDEEGMRLRVRRLLEDRGYGRSAARIDMARLQADIQARYGLAALVSVGLGPAAHGVCTWLERAVGHSGKTLRHPMQYLLLLNMLECSWPEFDALEPGERRERRTPVPRSAAQIENDLVAEHSHKIAIRSYLKEHPSATRSEMRARLGQACTLIGRVDPDWLATTLPLSRRMPGEGRRVDWPKRDRTYLGVLREVLRDELGSTAEPVRITINMLAQRSGIPPSTLTYGRWRLPLTTAMLRMCLEKRAAFRSRHLAFGDRARRSASPSLSPDNCCGENSK